MPCDSARGGERKKNLTPFFPSEPSPKAPRLKWHFYNEAIFQFDRSGSESTAAVLSIYAHIRGPAEMELGLHGRMRVVNSLWLWLTLAAWHLQADFN